MHSSRMRTVRLLTVSPEEGISIQWGWTDPPGHVTSDACWEANPPPLWTEGMTHTCKKTLPCPKFRLRVVINSHT